jgi:uncharacterized protein YjbI with pentapeptide repeats
MANDEHVAILKRGVAAWNAWRNENPDICPDLRGADLTRSVAQETQIDAMDHLPGTWMDFFRQVRGAALGLNLSKADLRQADLSFANLSKADLSEANLQAACATGANLFRAVFYDANLMEADLCCANLQEAILPQASLVEARLYKANLSKAKLLQANLMMANLNKAVLAGADLAGANLLNVNLSEADLTGANLQYAGVAGADFTGADLTGCRIHGVSAWRLKLDGVKQQDLIITSSNEPEITVDNIEVAQFIYVLLHNQNIRHVIDTVTSKVVLILGRFTKERKVILDALREELRERDYVPILFDFDPSATRDITETITLLARMARFIIADVTDPSSIPKELEAIVPDLAVPVQPLIEGASRPYAMLKDYWKYEWVLPVYRYEGLEPLLATLAEKVIAPAEAKVNALQEKRRMIEAELTKPR